MNSSNPAIEAIAIGSYSGSGAPSQVAAKNTASSARPVTQARTERRSSEFKFTG